MSQSLAAQSAIERLGDATSIAVTQIVSVPLGPARFATAVRASDGTLRVIAWQLGSDGLVSQIGSESAGATDRIAAAQMGRNQLVTAVRTEGGDLKLISWRVGATGTVTRSGSADAGLLRDVAIVAINRNTAVTAVRTSESDLKLISWRVDSVSGAITRLRDTSFGKSVQQEVVSVAPGRIVVAIRPTSGHILLRALDVDATGGFTSRGTISGPRISEFTMATLSGERVVTAGRRADDGSLVLTSWNVTPSGVLTQRSEANAGTANAVAVATRGTAHAIVAVRLAAGTMRLIAWDAVGDLVRLNTVDAGNASLLTAITLGTDRIITAVKSESGAMKVIAWRDRAVTLLRGEWGPQVRMLRRPIVTALPDVSEAHTGIDVGVSPGLPPHRAPRPGGLRPGDPGWRVSAERMEPLEAGAPSPALFGTPIRTGVNSAGYDPMIAVGHKFIMVSQDHEVAFFNRDGQLLAPRNGLPVQMSADEFFATFVAADNANGTPNEQNINRHIGTGPWFAECHAVQTPNPCIVEFYDTRVIYDRTSRRFVVVSAARGDKLTFADGTATKATDPAVRRYFAIAISKTEDPRDGFWQYMTTESSYSDWPRVIAQHGVVVMAHNSYQTQEWREGPTPTAYIFPMDSLKNGRPRPPSWKLFASETDANVVPVANHGTITGDWTSLTRRDGDVLHLYSFRAFASLSQPSSVKHTSVTLDATLPDQRNVFDVRRGDNLYLAGHLKVEDMVANVRPARYSVRVVRIPLILGTAGLPAPSTLPSRGFLDTYFGLHATSDAASDRVSYEVPSVAVTQDGNMVFVYGRIPVQTASPLFPEARYSVYYADARGLSRSRLLKAGEWMPTARFDSLATTVTVRPFVNGGGKLDHTSASVDPVDDRTVWIAAAFADSTLQGAWDTACGQAGKPKCRRWRSMVIGRVKP